MGEVSRRIKKVYNDLNLMDLAARSKIGEDIEKIDVFIEDKYNILVPKYTESYVSSEVVKKLDMAKDELREWVPKAAGLLKEEYSTGIRRFTSEYMEIAEEMKKYGDDILKLDDIREDVIERLNSLNRIVDENMKRISQLRCEHIFTSEYNLDHYSLALNEYVNDVEEKIKSCGGKIDTLNRLIEEIKRKIKESRKSLEKVRGKKWHEVLLTMMSSERIVKDIRDNISKRRGFEQEIEMEMSIIDKDSNDIDFNISNYKKLKQVQFIANTNIEMMKSGLKTVKKMVNLWGEVSCGIWGCIKYLKTEEIAASHFFKQFYSDLLIEEWDIVEKFIQELDIAEIE